MCPYAVLKTERVIGAAAGGAHGIDGALAGRSQEGAWPDVRRLSLGEGHRRLPLNVAAHFGDEGGQLHGVASLSEVIGDPYGLRGKAADFQMATIIAPSLACDFGQISSRLAQLDQF